MTDLNDPAIQLPAVIEANHAQVARKFWTKLKKVAGRIPFADDVLTIYYCARDPLTPTRVRGIILAALAYFILPADLLPDFIAGLGFTDDASVLATAIAMVTPYLKDHHRDQARAALARLRGEAFGPTD